MTIPNMIFPQNAEYNKPIWSVVGNGPKGDKGDKGDAFKYKDFTSDQIKDLKQGILFSGNKSKDAVVTTTETTNEITIPIADYDEFSMLFVDVNGLDLAEHEDYEISGNKIILTTSLPAGQDVHFRAVYYEIADGDKNILNYMGRKDYNTVAEMKADMDLEAGDICHVLGKATIGDLLGGWFKISSHGVADNLSVFLLDNDCYATRIPDSLIFQTPDSTKWYRVSVDDSGNLVTTQITS